MMDPYQPPAADPSPLAPAGPPAHSGAPKVFGILSIIFASLVLLVSLMGALGGAVGSNLEKFAGQAADAEAFLAPMARVYRATLWTSMIQIVMSALLLAIGIGQVKYRAWAQRWSVYWGCAALFALAVMVYLSISIIGPAYREMFDAISKHPPAGQHVPPIDMSGFGSLFGGSMALFMVLFYAPYPILLVIFFSRERVRAAMNR